MNRFRKQLFIFFAALIFAGLYGPLGSLTAYAMNVRISFSDPTVQTGSEVSVTMKVTSETKEKLGSAKIMLGYDASLLEFESGDHAEGGAGSVSVKGQDTTDKTEWTYTLKFKALKAGTAEIKVTKQEVYDTSQKAAKADKIGSSKVKITAASQSPTEAALSSLKISPGTLKPDFSADVTEYTATVGEGVDKITVSAPAKDGGAKVVISGNESLKMGENTISCKVTAQDGTTVKTYTIKVTKQKGDTPTAGNTGYQQSSGGKVTINGSEYEIASTFDVTLLPEGTEKSTYTYKGVQVQSGKLAKSDLVLMYLIGKGGAGDFYLYDEKTDSWSPYAAISVSSKTITVIPLEANVQIPEGFSESTLELNGKKVRGWIWASDPEKRYCIFYGMNKNGDKNFYRYDMNENEKTIQRYFKDPAIETGVNVSDYTDAVNQYNSLLSDYKQRGMILLIVVIALAAALAAYIMAAVSLKRVSKIAEGKSDNAGKNPGTAASGTKRHWEEEKTNGPAGRPLKPKAETPVKTAEQAEEEITKELAGEVKKAGKSETEDDFEDVKL
jgi:hypothetical protein